MIQHPYCYPGTNVYRNKLNFHDRDELDEFECEYTSWRVETRARPAPLTPAGYRSIHRFMLKDIHDWAGKYRWVDTGRGAPFCKAEYIHAEMERRFKLLHGEKYLRGLSVDAFAERAAEHVNELNAIHPFLDGNGRTNRCFL